MALSSGRLCFLPSLEAAGFSAERCELLVGMLLGQGLVDGKTIRIAFGPKLDEIESMAVLLAREIVNEIGDEDVYIPFHRAILQSAVALAGLSWTACMSPLAQRALPVEQRLHGGIYVDMQSGVEVALERIKAGLAHSYSSVCD